MLFLPAHALGRRCLASAPAPAAAAQVVHRVSTPRSRTPLLRLQATASGGRLPDSDETPANKAANGTPSERLQAPQPASSPEAEPGTSQLEAKHGAPAVQDAAAQPDAPAAMSSGPLPDASGAAASGSLGPPEASSGAGAAAVGGGGGGAPGPSAVTLVSRFNGVGYTFVLAGFLKIVTVGGLALSAPTDVARTAFGKATPYLMIPVGLGMCWVAKQVVDTGLNDSKRFLQYMAAALVVLYFGLVKLMYKYDPQLDLVRRPRPRMPGQMAELRSQLGDRELLAAGDMDSSRFYEAEKPGSRELYDDVAWYEGRYPSQLAAPGQQQKRGNARRAALAVTDTEEEYSVGANRDVLQSRLGPRSSAEPAAAPARRSFLNDSTR